MTHTTCSKCNQPYGKYGCFEDVVYSDGNGYEELGSCCRFPCPGCGDEGMDCACDIPAFSDLDAVAAGHTPTINRYAAAGEAVLRSGEGIPSVIQMEAMEHLGWKFETDPQGEYLAYSISPTGEAFEFDWVNCKVGPVFVYEGNSLK